MFISAKGGRVFGRVVHFGDDLDSPHFDPYHDPVCAHNQAKIIKKSVILFWLLNMTI